MEEKSSKSNDFNMIQMSEEARTICNVVKDYHEWTTYTYKNVIIPTEIHFSKISVDSWSDKVEFRFWNPPTVVFNANAKKRPGWLWAGIITLRRLVLPA